MGDRFYQQQYGVTLGAKPSSRTTQRSKRVSNWTDERKEEAKTKYLEADPTPENSMEIVKAIAEDMDESPNGVRLILSKMGVYVKKNPNSGTSKSGGGKSGGGGGARGSKQANIDRLNKAIEATGREPDTSITEKLTGKAAAYFADILGGVEEEPEEDDD